MYSFKILDSSISFGFVDYNYEIKIYVDYGNVEIVLLVFLGIYVVYFIINFSYEYCY